MELTSARLHTFLTMFNLLPIGTVLCHQRVITHMNPAFAEMFGYRREDLVGQSLEILYPSRYEFLDRGERWHGYMRERGGHADERLMLCKGAEPINIRVKGRCRDRLDPYREVACTFEPLMTTTLAQQLSQRESEIVTAMADGMTSKEIARLLGLSHRTVETYRARLMKKTGARNASQLLALLA